MKDYEVSEEESVRMCVGELRVSGVQEEMRLQERQMS
jgi:hypothetical protein